MEEKENFTNKKTNPNYCTVSLRIPKDKKREIDTAVEARGMTIFGWVMSLVDKELNAQKEAETNLNMFKSEQVEQINTKLDTLTNLVSCLLAKN